MAQWFGRLSWLPSPCCQSSWASAFENLLEAFNLTVTSNGAFVLFLCQLSVESSNHYAKANKLAIRKIWITVVMSWQHHVAKDLMVIWLTAHRMKLKLVKLRFIFCSDQWIQNRRKTVRPRTQNAVLTSVLSNSKFICYSSDSWCMPFVSCNVS